MLFGIFDAFVVLCPGGYTSQSRKSFDLATYAYNFEFWRSGLQRNGIVRSEHVAGELSHGGYQ